MLQKPELSAGLMGLLVRMQTSPLSYFGTDCRHRILTVNEHLLCWRKGSEASVKTESVRFVGDKPRCFRRYLSFAICTPAVRFTRTKRLFCSPPPPTPLPSRLGFILFSPVSINLCKHFLPNQTPNYIITQSSPTSFSGLA